MPDLSRPSETPVQVQAGCESTFGPLSSPPEVLVAFRQRPDFTFAWVDPALEQLAGVSAGTWGGRPADFWALVHEDDRAWLREHLAGNTQWSGWLKTRYRLRHALTGQVCHVLDCRRRWKEKEGGADVFDGFWFDQTRLRRAERRLATAGGKETLTQLTAGYVHDLNNVFAGISTVAQLCLMDMSPDHPLRGNLEMIGGNTGRASQLLQDLSGLVHPGRPRSGYRDLNELGRTCLRLLQPGLLRRITLEPRWAGVPLPVLVDGSAFQQAVFHLVLNAAAAITGSGEIVLETSRQEIFRPGLAWAGAVGEGPFACLAVKDTGCGICSEDGPRLFDWCYSARVGNGGVGIGLAYVGEFVSVYRGAVTVGSTPGRGATFQIWLPLVDFGEPETSGSGLEHLCSRVLVAGSGAEAGEVLVAVLRARGWEVVWAKRDAVLTLAAGEESYSAVIVIRGETTAGLEAWVGRVRQEKVPLRIAWVDEAGVGSPPQAFLEQADLILDWADGAERAGARIGRWLEETVGAKPKRRESASGGGLGA